MWPFKKVKPGIAFEKTQNGAVLTRYSGEDEAYIIPDEYENLPVTEIAANAFKDAKRLKAVYMGKNIQKIGKKAFSGCAENLSLVLNESAERQEGALIGCKSIYYETDSGLTLVSYAGHETDIVLESECFHRPVTAVGEKVFYMFAYLKSVSLPKSLLSIGQAAFAGCSDLTDIVFPPCMEEIGNEAFLKSGLTSVTVPESMKTVGEKAFFACEDLKTAVFKGKNTAIGAAAFAKCALTGITLPENLTELQSEVLRENKSLTSLTIPKSVEAVWEYALADTSLERIELPDACEVIGEGAFSGSKALKEVRFSRAVREIGPSALSFCPQLSSLYLPCPRFEVSDSLLIDTQSKTVLACISNLSGENLAVPDGVKSVSDCAFAGNENIKNLVLPESVVYAGVWAFRDMKNLNTLEIRSDKITFGDSPLFGSEPEYLICEDHIHELLESFIA